MVLLSNFPQINLSTIKITFEKKLEVPRIEPGTAGSDVTNANHNALPLHNDFSLVLQASGQEGQELEEAAEEVVDDERRRRRRRREERQREQQGQANSWRHPFCSKGTCPNNKYTFFLQTRFARDSFNN